MQHPDPGRLVADRETGLGVYRPVMRELVNLASRVAAVDSTILIVGESGVGKSDSPVSSTTPHRGPAGRSSR